MQLRSMDYLCCPACNGSLKLNIVEELDTEVVGGVLECYQCKRHFEITDGLPNLIFPEKLEESDVCAQIGYDRSAELYDLRVRWGALKMGIWQEVFMLARSRQILVDKLELRRNGSVLETGTGTGLVLPGIAGQIGKEGQLHGSDISAPMLKVAQRKMGAKRIKAELLLSNASYLPYRTSTFDAVLQTGGWNTFAEKKRAMEEMYRVAKPGAKIVICDEGMSPGKKKTWMGRRILRRDKEGLYAMKPPRELVPDNTEGLKAYYIWHDIYWVVEFRKGS
jgi:uncharacterized protein YbaR (Trm112 family)/SAM-dependent methyltransferase